MEITTYQNPFARARVTESVTVGTVAIESERAIAEAQAKLVIAKRFPRDQARAFDRIMEACSRMSLASNAEYAFPRGNQVVRGPSIRLAEELARCWGNLDYGIRELSRANGVSEMEAYCWDLETNTYSSQKFTVRHVRDTKAGGKELNDERDIYELTANQGARRLRARILAILPSDLVEAAIERCRQTLAGNTSEPISDRVRKMIAAFKTYGVTEAHLSAYLGKSLDKVLPEDLTDLAGVYNSIKAGVASASEFFGHQDERLTTRSFQNLGNQQRDASQQAIPVAKNAENEADTTAEWPKPNADGELVDVRGIPWDERIHAKTCTMDGTWRKRRGVDPALVAKLENEALARLAKNAEPSTEPPAAVDPEPTIESEAHKPTDDQPTYTYEQICEGLACSKDEYELNDWVGKTRSLTLTSSQLDNMDRIYELSLRRIRGS